MTLAVPNGRRLVSPCRRAVLAAEPFSATWVSRHNTQGWVDTSPRHRDEPRVVRRNLPLSFGVSRDRAAAPIPSGSARFLLSLNPQLEG